MEMKFYGYFFVKNIIICLKISFEVIFSDWLVDGALSVALSA